MRYFSTPTDDCKCLCNDCAGTVLREGWEGWEELDPTTLGDGVDAPACEVCWTNQRRNEMTKRVLLESVQTGTRRIAGTDFPIFDQLHREQRGKRVRWIVTRGLCNGVPNGAQEFKRLKDARGDLA